LPEDWWGLSEIAQFLGVASATISSYRTRGNVGFPEPDRMFGRSPAWRPATIRAWNERRRGRGWRGQPS
jgi:predicted DNA-binding transcriptional regulator AlpA